MCILFAHNSQIFFQLFPLCLLSQFLPKTLIVSGSYKLTHQFLEYCKIDFFQYKQELVWLNPRRCDIAFHRFLVVILVEPASVAQLDAPSDWRPGGRGFNPRRGRQHSFVEIDHEIFSTVILSLPLIQEGQLSVSGERMCTILVNRLED